MNSRHSVQSIYGYVFIGLLWLVLAASSGSLLWAIFGGLGASGVTMVTSRQWTNALAAGAVVAIVISVFGIAAMLSPGWYKNVL